MKFSIKSGFAIIAVVAVVLACVICVRERMAEWNGAIGILSLILIPTAPFIFGGLGFALAPLSSDTLTHDSKMITALLATVVGLCVSILSCLLFNHIVSNYWAG